MNKKTFTLAVLFFCVTLVWFGVNVYWDCVRRVDVYNTLLSLLFVVFGAPWSGTKRRRNGADTSPRRTNTGYLNFYRVMKLNLMQVVRLVLMVLAVAGIIYALEYVPHGIAVWFWVALLGVGFVGLLYTFRLTQRRLRREQREEELREKRRLRRSKR